MPKSVITAVLWMVLVASTQTYEITLDHLGVWLLFLGMAYAVASSIKNE